ALAGAHPRSSGGQPVHRPRGFRDRPGPGAPGRLGRGRPRLPGAPVRDADRLERGHRRMTDVVDKLWGFCHVLRHDGIDYGAYIEQITYLLFLKMADERGIELPPNCDWTTLTEGSGTELADHYADLLRTLGRQPGLLGDVFAGARSAFSNPV